MDQKKRGRPLGSKNKAKILQPVNNNTEFAINGVKPIDLIEVIDLDYPNSGEEKNTSLLGFVPGFGDWDFGIQYPFFFGTKIPTTGSFILVDHASCERINKAFVKIGIDKKPEKLVLFGQRLIGPNYWTEEVSVVYFFKDWPLEYTWEENQSHS